MLPDLTMEMRRIYLGRAGVALAVIAAASWPAGTPARAETGTPPANCPGYVMHLRNARAYLVKGNRSSAVAELRQAEQALDSCTRGEAQSSLVAGTTPAHHTG